MPSEHADEPASATKPSGLFSDTAVPARDSTKGLPGQTPSNAVDTPGSGVPKDAAPGSSRPQGGKDGKGVGKSESEAEQRATPAGATDAKPSESSQAPESGADSDAAGDDAHGAAGASAAPNAGSDSIDLPDFEIDSLDADTAALRRAGNTKPIDAHPLAGVWEQIDGPATADFGPGGYERSVLMLNPGTKTAALYRVFRGSIVLVMGGELALDAPRSPDGKREGQLQLRVDASLPSKFPGTRVPLGGDPQRFADPPQGGSPWTLAWKREKQQLVLDGKRYSPTTVDAFESIRRGGGDVATDAERRETAPTRPAQSVGAGPKPKEAAFFGVRGGGKRFVFIVDISGSMLGPKLDRMKDELTKSIRSLDADAEFSIVFFAGSARVIDQAWMQARADRDRAINLIAQQGCDGGTDPTTAFEFAFHALSPVPDCIFFMTDGLIPPTIPAIVRSLNSARIPTEIHSIVIGAAAEEPLMRPLMEEIAKENHGTYTFVPQ